MPTYGYECKFCGHRFEVFQKMSEDPVKTCPKCRKSKATRRIQAPGFILRGSGFYATEYRRGKSEEPSKKEDKKK